METEKKTLPGVFRLIKEAFGLYGRNYKTFFKIGFVFVVVGLILSVISLLINPQALISSSIALYFLITIVLAVIMIVVQIIYQTTLTKTVSEVDTNQPTSSLKESYKKGIKLFPSYLWIYILMMLSMGSIIMLVVFAVTLIAGMAVVLGGVVGTILIVLAYLALMAVTIALTVYVMFAFYSLIIDGHRGLKALSASFYYVYKNWWKVFWRFFVPGVLIFIIVAIIGVVIYFIFMSGKDPMTISAEMRAYSSSISISYLIFSLIAGILSSCIIMPILNSYAYLVFKNLKLTKPEPVPEKDFATSKIWFMVLSIIGLVIGVVFGIIFIFGVIAGYKGAAMRANTVQQMQQAAQARTQIPTESRFPSSAISLPARLGSLQQTPYINKELGFSINLPKKWVTSADSNGVYASEDLSGNVDVDMVIEKKVLPEEALAVPDEVLMEQVASNILETPTFTNVNFTKYNISGQNAYMISGNVTAKDKELVAEFYFIRDGKNVYTITTTAKVSAAYTISPVLLDSVNTFKITK
jgi:hypothetical protein